MLALNNLVEQYLVFAEGQAMRRIPMYMSDWIAKLDAFLQPNDRDVLGHAGKISHDLAIELASKEYEKYHASISKQAKELPSDFDLHLKELKRFPKKRQ